MRLSVWITVDGGKPIEALLDTGSTGLFVLASAVPTARSLPDYGGITSYYSSGDKFIARKTQAAISFGDGGPGVKVPFGLVKAVQCITEIPKCPAAHVKFDDYRIAGEFKAILGIDFGNGNLPNPLPGLGTSRWIIDLSKDRIILDPDESDLVGFTFYQVAKEALVRNDGFRSAISGCLVARRTGDQICGPILLDTGNTGIAVKTKDTAFFDRMWLEENFTAEFGTGDNKTKMDLEAGSGSFKRLVPAIGRSFL
jgi:hypothetical protein